MSVTVTLEGTSDDVVVTLASTSDDVVVTLISTALESGDDDMPQPTTATPIAAGASPTTLNQNGNGFIYSVIVTSQGSTQINIRSGGPSGAILAVVAPNAPLGAIPSFNSAPYNGGLYVGSGTGSAAITVLYS